MSIIDIVFTVVFLSIFVGTVGALYRHAHKHKDDVADDSTGWP
jgi:hypothetical protein